MRTYAFTLVSKTIQVENCFVGFRTKAQAISAARKALTKELPHAEVFLCPGTGEDIVEVAYLDLHKSVDLVTGKITVTHWE